MARNRNASVSKTPVLSIVSVSIDHLVVTQWNCDGKHELLPFWSRWARLRTHLSPLFAEHRDTTTRRMPPLVERYQSSRSMESPRNGDSVSSVHIGERAPGFRTPLTPSLRTALYDYDAQVKFLYLHWYFFRRNRMHNPVLGYCLLNVFVRNIWFFIPDSSKLYKLWLCIYLPKKSLHFQFLYERLPSSMIRSFLLIFGFHSFNSLLTLHNICDTLSICSCLMILSSIVPV